MKNKLYYKKIKLSPTNYSLQVFVCKDVSHTIATLNRKIEKYDWDKWFLFDTNGFFVKYITKNNRIRLIMCLYDFSHKEIAHEAVHVTWELARLVEFKYKKDEELQAYYVGYIVDEIMKMKK